MQNLLLLKKLLRINSQSGNVSGIREVYEVLRHELLGLGFIEKSIQSSGLPPLGYFESQNMTEGPKLLISGHMDTVFPAENIKVKIKGDKLFGSGANDMKGGLVAMVEGLKLLKNTGESFKNIGIILSPDEEKGSALYTKEMINIYKQYEYALVLEGKGDNGELCSERRGIATFILACTGKKGHSGHFANLYPNAIEEGAAQILSLVKLAERENGLTINIGKAAGGDAINVVADTFTTEGDIRFATEEQYNKVAKYISSVLGYHPESVVNIAINKLFPAMQENKKTNVLKKIVADGLTKIGLEVKYEKRGSASDGNLMASLGLGVIDGFGTIGGDIHTLNEWMSVKSLTSSSNVIETVIRSFLQIQV